MRSRNLKTKGKILILFISTLLLFSVVVNIIIYVQFNSYITNCILKTNANLSLELINQKYVGNWSVQDGKLYKGDTLMNDNFEIVDIIKSATDAECTIFLNDTRITTTVIKDNNRATGTQAAAKVVQTVLTNGKQYIGSAKVIDTPFETVYTPIKDSSGTNIGMLFIGIASKDINSKVSVIVYKIIEATILLAAISIILTVLFTERVVGKPLKDAKEHLEMLADGDLTFEISPFYLSKGDEFGDIARAVNDTKNSFHSIISGMNEKSQNIDLQSDSLSSVSEEMASASGNITVSIQDIAKGNTHQADELVDISSITNTFGNKLENITTAFEGINKNTNEIGTQANESVQTMANLSNSINEVRDVFQSNSENMEAWGTKIEEINNISSMINEISSQTNLLSLNAAIEAARAGEAGKGFAVVADEIRKLAEESRKSSESITALVNDIIVNSDNMIRSSAQMSDQLSDEISIVKNAMDSFDGIVQKINQIIPTMQEVNSSSLSLEKDKNNIIIKIDQSASVAAQVSASSHDISAASQEMNASTEEVAIAAQSLSQLTREMLHDISKFKL